LTLPGFFGMKVGVGVVDDNLLLLMDYLL
jgi:hypothetical protein